MSLNVCNSYFGFLKVYILFHYFTLLRLYCVNMYVGIFKSEMRYLKIKLLLRKMFTYGIFFGLIF